MKKSTSNRKKLLAHSVKGKSLLKGNLKKLMTKYVEQKLLINKLNQRIMRQEEKLMQQNQYIIELEKYKKIAESVDKNNVSNSITASAQNQTPMKNQSTQQVLPSRGPNILSQSSSTLQMLPRVLPYQFPWLINLNIQPGQRYFFHSKCHGYFNNTQYCGYYGLRPRNYM